MRHIFAAIKSFQQNTRCIASSKILNDISGMRPQNIDVNPKKEKPKKWFTGDDHLVHMHRKPYYKCLMKRKRPVFDGKPLCRGIVLKTLIKKPRKPNSGNRKCVQVKLSTGKIMVAYVPGEGHNLQEHNAVLCRIARLRDTPGIRIKCIRGAYDLPHVVKKKQE